MNKIIHISCFLFVLMPAIAQKGMDGLIRAENNFAAYSVSHSTKEAFLEYIDSNSIMFDSSRAIKAIDFWNKRKKSAGVLNWHPQYAEISASGDFGFTTGPWTFRPTANDTVVAAGRYITVWHLNKELKWKFLADLGVDNIPVHGPEKNIDINAAQYSVNYRTIASIPPLAGTENDFIQLYKESQSKAYKKYLSGASILNRNGFAPAVNNADQQLIINSTPPAAEYKLDGWGISTVPDMGYTYGTAVINGKAENYLRIWRMEKEGWKIALEVLRY
ncbi:MAG: hypothetical protein ABL876_00675 [Chitinophagaceae bacterium]